MNLSKCLIFFLLASVFFLLHYCNLNNLETRSENFYQKTENNKKVHDIFHDFLPHINTFEYMPDILLVSLFAYMTIVNYNLIYQFAGLAFTLIIVRSLIINMTVLPKNNVCNIKKDSSLFRGGCYDKIFSGHFGITFLMTLLLYDNGYINQFVAILVNFLNAILILLTRSHYTIDIIVSIFVVIIIYQNNLNICEYLDKCF
jgi:hypothetical protein